jgi:hypothetical protein
MSSVTISSEPPTDWAAACAEEGLLFHSGDWISLLDSAFNVRTQYIWDEATACGGAVSSFAAGPFKLGYLGFPYGGLVGGAGLNDEILQSWREQLSGLLPMAIRIPASAFAESVDLKLPFESTPETAIVDLPSWTLAATSGNHRRDIKKAIRSGLEILDADLADDGVEIFKIYHDTVKRHRGGLRYNETYFRDLVALAQSNPHVRVTVARLEKKMAGFTVVIRHGSVACYLHGGIDLNYRAYQPSALLLNEAIEWAKGRGCQCFNLMSSPVSQQSLVWYKEKWGAETREHRSFTLVLRSSYQLFRIAERLSRLLR